MKVTVGVRIGADKAECEDAAFVNQFLTDEEIREYDCPVLRCVGAADGVGGNAGGKLASGFVASGLSSTDFSCMTEEQLRHHISALNEALIRYAGDIPGKREMATTLTCLVAGIDGYYLIHSGNTRLYVMQGAYLKQVTQDHTTFNWLRRLGQYEAADQCRKSEINCCLGGGDHCYANQTVIERLFDDALPHMMLITSDGVHESVDIDAIEEILNGADTTVDAIRALLNKAEENGSMDDKTVIIVRG